MVSAEAERRSEPRRVVDDYYSVEFSVAGIEVVYQFKIWNVSSRGMCLLVRQNSDILRHLRVGDTIEMKFYKSDATKPSEYIKMQISHITKDEVGKFKDHFLVGLCVAQN